MTRTAKHEKEVIMNHEEELPSVSIFNSDQLKGAVEKLHAAIDRKNQANSDVRSAFDAAEKMGIPKAELKFIIKLHTKPLSEDFKATVNIMNEMLGKQAVFSFVDAAEYPLIQKH
jgi:hypothetical protein